MTLQEKPTAVLSSQPVRISYSVTRWDLFRWHLYSVTHQRTTNLLFLIISLFMAWRDLSTPAMSEHSIAAKLLVAILFMVFGWVAFVSFTLFLVTCQSMFSKKRGILGNHEVELQDDGLAERTDVNESLFRWNGFHKIVTTGRLFIVYVTDNTVLVIPLRSFASEQDQKTFRDEIQRRIDAAQPNAV